MNTNRYWSPLVASLEPYVPGEQPRGESLVKLNTNENPFGPSPRVIAAIREAAEDSLRLYPDPDSLALRQTIARYHGLAADQVFVGNGSDEVLAHAFLAFFKQERPIQFPDITYSFYPVYCRLYEVPFTTLPLDADFAIPVEQFDTAAGGLIFPNPNAPTGRALTRSAIEAVLRRHPDKLVLVDEAYVDFGGESAIPLVAQYPNLLVTQTLSKSRSLAGLRVGFAVGDPALIEALNRVKNSFNSYPLDRLALAGAMAAFEDEEWFQQCRGAVIAERERLEDALAGLGFQVLPSAANFLFASHPDHRGADLARALRQRGVIVRHFAKPRIEDYLRITIGSSLQNDRLLEALRDFLGEA